MRKSSNSYGPKKTLFITLASTLLFSLLLLASHELPNSVYANTYPNLFPGVGIATIDGFIDPAEWANADSVSFTTEGPAEITGTFYVMQSNTMLYLGVSLADDELNQEYWYGLYGDTIFFDFDDDNSGSLYEIGENRFVSYAYSPWFSDDFFHTDNSAGFSSPDTSQPGGVNNGDARAARNSDLNMYEVAYPLCSGDSYDFCLHPADIVGLRVKYYDIYRQGDSLLASVGFFPGQNLDSLALIHVREISNNYLPLIMK
jgi:hypothetical protein